MTRIDPALLVSLTQALQTPARNERAKETSDAAERAGARGRTPAGTRSHQLVQLIRRRVEQMNGARNLTDEDVLTVAIQETLALEFGEDIAAHPRFKEVTRRIQETLEAMPEFRALLPLLAEKARSGG